MSSNSMINRVDLNVRLMGNASFVFAFVIRTGLLLKTECKETALSAFLLKPHPLISLLIMGIKSIEIFLNVIEKQMQLMLR